jgi:hypothetical protein
MEVSFTQKSQLNNEIQGIIMERKQTDVKDNPVFEEDFTKHHIYKFVKKYLK